MSLITAQKLDRLIKIYEAKGFSEAELKSLKGSLENRKRLYRLAPKEKPKASRQVINGTIEVRLSTGPSLPDEDKDRKFRKI